jgi:hypothetical protein
MHSGIFFVGAPQRFVGPALLEWDKQVFDSSGRQASAVILRIKTDVVAVGIGRQ